jgi:pimeloyl-ACP methyl ester carboxylesterase
MNPSLHYVPFDISGNTYKLAYWQHGNSNPNQIVLCVHGLTRNARDFDFLGTALAANYTVICPDMPGRGKSDWLKDTKLYNYDTYMAAVNALLQSLGNPSVHWIGTSLGGILGMRYAAEQPMAVSSLLLNDVGAVIPLEGLKRINEYVGICMNFAGREEAENYLRTIFAHFGISDSRHWHHLLEHSFQQLSNGEYQFAYDPGILDPLRDQARLLTMTEDLLLWGWWDVITAPILILRGEKSDILTKEIAAEMLARRPQAKQIVIPHVGHAPALMADSQIEIVQGWLKSHPALVICESQTNIKTA